MLMGSHLIASLFETVHGCSFVVVSLEYREQFGDHEQVLNLLGQIQEFQLTAAIIGGGVGTDELTYSGAVHVGDVSQIEQNLLFAVIEQLAHGLTQLHAAFADGYFPGQVQYGYVAGLAFLKTKLSHLNFSFFVLGILVTEMCLYSWS